MFAPIGLIQTTIKIKNKVQYNKTSKNNGRTTWNNMKNKIKKRNKMKAFIS